MTDIQVLANQVQEIAQQIGIRKYDISGSSVDETSVQVDRGEPKQVKASNRSSVTVRVWNQNNTVGIASTTDSDAKGLELALKTAADASEFGAKDHVPDFSPEATKPIENQKTVQVPPLDVTQLIERLVDLEKQLLDAHPAIASVPYNGLAQRDLSRFYLNSEGAQRHEAHSVASVYLYSKTEQEGKKPRSAGAYKVNVGVEQLDFEGCLKEAAEKTISHLNYQKVKTGKYRVVFSPEAFLSLINAFSNLYNAQSILDKRSLSTPDSLGTQVASPLLSVFNDALHADNPTSSYFDGEGTPTRRVPLIEGGVLTGFLHSAGTAKRMNTQPTGHANMGAKVTISPDFYHIFAASQPEQTYALETEENLVFIDDLSALHAGVNALQGSFSLPFDGWLVNKGEKVSVDSATVAGDIREVLKSIIYVEPEAEVTPGGVCPRIWVEGLSVTGE
ncbi:TldD/PmbA family protein [Phormidium yuhuli AB48]|uniref:TldD/PmbA family protein n=1 Tax=Phormidium yuhuli AB48 TaxID=2940671 RepID=A0ABY5AUQ9_9CYAN|nr:TldD/PmbA family protein [Phormidium yuhuli]USR92982.1 TldD/PmbA family protein [Phormidium yuhuli AB48]